MGVYNRITELCFNACVDNLSIRNCTQDEDICVDNCYKKFSSTNQRFLAIYMEQQSEVNKRRAADLAEQERLAIQKAREESLKGHHSQPVQQTLGTTNPSSSQPVEEVK